MPNEAVAVSAEKLLAKTFIINLQASLESSVSGCIRALYNQRILKEGNTMLSERGVDFDWSTLFNLKKEEKQKLVDIIRQYKADKYDFVSLLEIDGENRQVYEKACEIETLDFCLNDSSFARDILNDEEYKKALNLFERKQYSSNLLKEILSKFYTALISRNSKTELLSAYLERGIRKRVNRIIDEETEKSFSELKKVIEKIASGVRSECYFAAEKRDFFRDEEETVKMLNGFIAQDYGFKDSPISLNNGGDTLNEMIYRKALLDDDSFWVKHEKFSIAAFTEAICRFNDEKHAKKVWAHIFDKIKANEIGAKLLENNLPVRYLFKDRIFDSLKDRVLRYFYRFEGIYDLEKIKGETCCYPFTKTDGVEEKIVCGKEILDGLFKTVYPSDYQKVIAFFNGQLDGEEPFKMNEYMTVKDLFVGLSSRLWYDDNERKAVLVYCPEYFSKENIWSRLYLIAFMANKLESNINKCYANLFEIFYDLFKAAEKIFGLKTAFQKDNGGREKAYAELKKTLQKYGLAISDSFKNDYITSLLDRKVAVIEEIERFPALEQLGDAVYGFAVAEMMFYQPTDYEKEGIFNDYDNYIWAETQVEIARTLGLDKLYISPLTLSYKYSGADIDPDDEPFLFDYPRGEREVKFKFLADSLEMVIGTICKDCGYQAAIEFSKRIVREQFPGVFKKEARWENRFEADSEQEIDGEYWNRIKPAPCPRFDTFESKLFVERMWDAFNKFMLTYSLGTDDKAVRVFITQRHSSLDYADELYGIKNLRYSGFNGAMYSYLHSGLAYMVENYSEKIKENYKNLQTNN